MSVITISQTAGSRGNLIGEKVAERLGFELIDKELLEHVSEMTDVSLEEVEQFDERVQSRTIRFLKTIFEPRFNGILHESNKKLKPGKFIETLSEVITGLADRGNYVIIGRASQFILKGRPEVIHVRTFCSEEIGIASLIESQGLTYDEAREFMQKDNKRRAEFIEKYFKADWKDIVHYDLLINSGKLGIGAAIHIIVGAAHKYGFGFEAKDRTYLGMERRQDKERRDFDRRTQLSQWSPQDFNRTYEKTRRPTRELFKTERRKDIDRRDEKRKYDSSSRGKGIKDNRPGIPQRIPHQTPHYWPEKPAKKSKRDEGDSK